MVSLHRLPEPAPAPAPALAQAPAPAPASAPDPTPTPTPTPAEERSSKDSLQSTEPDYQWIIGPIVGSFLGNALLLGVGALLVLVWHLFEDYREPLLWGLWCSVALRGAKEWLVASLERHLRAR